MLTSFDPSTTSRKRLLALNVLPVSLKSGPASATPDRPGIPGLTVLAPGSLLKLKMLLAAVNVLELD